MGTTENNFETFVEKVVERIEILQDNAEYDELNSYEEKAAYNTAYIKAISIIKEESTKWQKNSPDIDRSVKTLDVYDMEKERPENRDAQSSTHIVTGNVSEIK